VLIYQYNHGLIIAQLCLGIGLVSGDDQRIANQSRTRRSPIQLVDCARTPVMKVGTGDPDAVKFGSGIVLTIAPGCCTSLSGVCDNHS